MTFPVRTAIADAVASAVASATQDATGAIQRIFITLNGIDEYFTMQNPVVETGDFRHSYLIASTNLTSDMALMDADITASGADGDVLLFIDSTDGLEFLVGDSGTGFTRTIFGGHASILDGKFNEIVLERTSGVVRALLNGVQLGGTVNESRILTFGGKFGGGISRFFDGIIANPDLGNGNAWQLGNPTGNTEQAANGNNLLTYVGAPKTELFTFNQSDAGWDGVDRVVNGAFANNGADWTVTAPGTESITFSNNEAALNRPADGDDPFMTNTGLVVSGETYKAAYDIISATDFSKNIAVKFGSQDTFLPTSITSVGRKNLTILATSSGVIGLGHGGSGPSLVVIDNYLVRRFIQIA